MKGGQTDGFFLRSATLQIGPLKYNMNDGFYFDFEVPFYDSDQLITASFTVYNLNPTSRQGIVKNQVVILNAGYEDDEGVLLWDRLQAAAINRMGWSGRQRSQQRRHLISG